MYGFDNADVIQVFSIHHKGMGKQCISRNAYQENTNALAGSALCNIYKLHTVYVQIHATCTCYTECLHCSCKQCTSSDHMHGMLFGSVASTMQTCPSYHLRTDSSYQHTRIHAYGHACTGSSYCCFRTCLKQTGCWENSSRKWTC